MIIEILILKKKKKDKKTDEVSARFCLEEGTAMKRKNWV